MKEFGKKLLGVASVAVVSSLVSIGSFSWLTTREGGEVKNELEVSENISSTQFAKPVNFGNTAISSAIHTDFTEAAASTVNGVVHIKSTVMSRASRGGSTGDPFFDLFFGNQGRNMEPRPQVGSGSGVIISSDGYIVTNNHVIDNSDMVEVTLYDNRKFNARVIGTDPSTDLALIKIDATDLPIVAFGDSDKLQVGEWVLAVGNPFQLTSTVTAGIVSAKARSIGILSNQKTMGIESFIQTDAVVNPGNSGGALVNTNGELVGVNTAIYSETGSFVGYSFAIPSSIVSKVITDLKQYGAVQKALLGVVIQDITAEMAAENNIEVQEGVYVQDLAERGAAIGSGIKKGDVIVAINNVPVKNMAALQEQIIRYRPGDKVKVDVVRNGEKKQYAVTLKNQQGTTEVTKAQTVDMLGAAFTPITDAQKRELGIRSGVQVSGIKAGRIKDAGIRNGFIILRINDKVVTNQSDIESLFTEIQRGRSTDKVMFIAGVYPNGKTGYYAVDLSE